MFKNREDLIDFLLTNDFDEKYSDLEYKYFLLAYKETFRNLHSKNAGLEQLNTSLENKIKILEKDKQDYLVQAKIKAETIKNLKEKIPKKSWWRKLFNKLI